LFGYREKRSFADDAPDVGQTVKIEDLRAFPDYADASRPTDM
jgi:hypothetical protein